MPAVWCEPVSTDHHHEVLKAFGAQARLISVILVDISENGNYREGDQDSPHLHNLRSYEVGGFAGREERQA